MLLIFLLNTILSALHPIHVSVSDVEITDMNITWTARIYKDDLLLGMYGENIDMSVFENEEKVRKDIMSYFSRSITVTQGNQKLKWVLKDIQADTVAIWIAASALIVSTASFTIHNRILLDAYNDQKNVGNFTWSTGKKNLVFEKGDDKKMIELH